MIEGLKPYAEYKESGQEWLGSVPAHWRTPRLKTVLREKDARSLDGSGLLLSLTRNRGLIARSDMTDKIHSARTLAGYKLYEPGEIVMNRMQAWSGMFGVGSKPGLVSPDYAVFKLLGADLVSLLLARIKAPDLVSQFALESKGIGSGFNRLYSDRFGAIPISLPPPDEQAAIVRFLDHANRKIDGFIRAKRKLIGLLNEQKQAIIHRAVTRGLHADVPLKPSGIPWLGDIPQHWEVRRLRTIVTKIEQGVSPQASGFLADRDSWGVLKSGCVNHGAFRQTEHKQLANGFDIDPAIVVKVGDVLISRACGSPKLVGSVGKVRALDYKLILSDKTFRAAFLPIVDSDFMVYAMNGAYYRQQVEQAISGADGMANNLPLSELRSFVFAIPPLAQAVEIASYLDAQLARFNTAIARTEREIALMQEYRTRLTADIVTGKLDVREAAAKLPEVAGQSDRSDPSDLSDGESDLSDSSHQLSNETGDFPFEDES